jgi:uncharacterized protein YbjT (DUF2867 family)
MFPPTTPEKKHVVKPLVFSASGSVGFELCQSLLAKDLPCKAAIRKGTIHQDRISELQRIAKKHPNKLEIVEVDWNDASTIRKALEGCDRVFLKCPLGQYQSATKTFVESFPEKTTVNWLVYFSVYDDPIKGRKGILSEDFSKGEQLLRNISIPYCIVRPSFLFSNFLLDAEEIKTKGVIARPLGNARINIVSDRDVAEASRSVLCENQAVHNGNTYYLFGKDCIDMDLFTKTLSDQLLRQITYQDISDEEFRNYLQQRGMTKEGVEHYLKLLECAKCGGYTKTESHIPRLLDRSPLSIQECIHENISLFQ